MKATKSVLASCIAAAILAGCANVPEGAGSNPADPWESMNRQTAAFNDVMDKYLGEPLARGYKAVVPEVARDRVTGVLSNLREPSNIVNNGLQGKGEGMLASIFRLLINTTLGLGGMFDVAGSCANQPERNEDFGQTLAVWGVPQGPYFVIPFLGPSGVRDAPARFVDWATTPTTYYGSAPVAWGVTGVKLLDARTRLLPATDLLKDAVDPYVMAREAYLSSRRNAIYDGNPPVEFAPDEFEDEDEPRKEVK